MIRSKPVILSAAKELRRRSWRSCVASLLRTTLLEEIVLRDRQRCRLICHVRLPCREDVEVPVQQEDFAAHFPSRSEPGQHAPLRLLDQMPEVVDHRLTLAEAGLRTEEVQRRLDLETLLIPNGNCVPHS